MIFYLDLWSAIQNHVIHLLPRLLGQLHGLAHRGPPGGPHDHQHVAGVDPLAEVARVRDEPARGSKAL